MKVFISWSGSAEKRVAEALREALGNVCAGEVDAFVSSRDIPLGERGIPMIEANLSSTDYGIVVLSAENKGRPWINYEAGALGTLLERRVAVVLLDLSRAEVDTPLAPFQSTLFHDRADMLRLFTEIAQLNRSSFPAPTVETLFNAGWEAIQKSWVPDPTAAPKSPRTSTDMLEELVEGMRKIRTSQRLLSERLDELAGSQASGSGLFGSGRVTTVPPTSLEVFKGLNERVKLTTKNRVFVTGVDLSDNDRWEVSLGGSETTLREEFDHARRLVRGMLPIGSQMVVLAPLEPTNVEEGRMPRDTVAAGAASVEMKDPLDP